jgi:hypothetical protein
MTVDEFAEYGVARMDEDAIDRFLTSQRMGVLGLLTGGAPSMRPLSYWHDGDGRLYFLYATGEKSRKADLSERADVARFLVFRADTRFQWQSVLLTGTIDEVPASERAAVKEAIELRHRPDAIDRASENADATLYAFRIDDRTGIKHLGLPPGFEADRGGE